MNKDMDSSFSNEKDIMLELPLNKEPLIRCYTPDAMMAAICSNSMCTGELLAQFTIYGENREWKPELTNMEFVRNQNVFSIYRSNTGTNMYCRFLCNCHDNDELIMRIDYQQYTCSLSEISFEYLEEKNYDESFKNIKIEHFSKMESNTWKDLVDCKLHDKAFINRYPIWIKTIKSKKEILFYISYDNVNWVHCAKYDLEYNNIKLLKIAINIRMYENQWENWFYSKFIQLKAIPSNENVHLAYNEYIEKSWKPNYVNLFLDYTTKDKITIKKYVNDYIDYLKIHLANECYIECYVDEYYLKGRLTYQKTHRNHNNLIYGYNDNEKFFMSMGIDENGYLVYTDIGYDIICEAIEKSSAEDIITLMKYNPTDCIYSLEMKQIKEQLLYYINSSDNKKRERFLIQEPIINSFFGVSIYDAFNIETFSGLLLSDLRIVYLLYEHHCIMGKRIDLLEQRGLLKQNILPKIKQLSFELIEQAEILKNTVIIYYLKRDNTKIEYIKSLLLRVHKADIEFCNELLLEL